jgi:hypothetical protein
LLTRASDTTLRLLGSDPLLPKIGVSRGLTTRAHRVYDLS